MKAVFDKDFFAHIRKSAIHEGDKPSRAIIIAEKIVSNPVLEYVIAILERIFSFIINLPIPIYSGLIYFWVTNSRGLPNFFGNYLRALYYRPRLGSMGVNTMIEQGVFFAHPESVFLADFCFIDKGVKVMSKTCRVGKRVHIAQDVFISGGGDFQIEDHGGIAPNVCIVTSTEVLKDGARCSGPMTDPAQRRVLRGSVHIERDAFVGANVTVLPNVRMRVGSVAGAGVVLAKDTEEWGIYTNAPARKLTVRQPVDYPV